MQRIDKEVQVCLKDLYKMSQIILVEISGLNSFEEYRQKYPDRYIDDVKQITQTHNKFIKVAKDMAAQQMYEEVAQKVIKEVLDKVLHRDINSQLYYIVSGIDGDVLQFRSKDHIEESVTINKNEAKKYPFDEAKLLELSEGEIILMCSILNNMSHGVNITYDAHKFKAFHEDFVINEEEL